MPWAALAYFATGPSATFPTSAADLFQIILGALNVGVCGLVAWLFIAGRIHSDSEIGRVTEALKRAEERAARAEQQRDEALTVATTQIAPILGNFVSTSQALIPLLQDLVRQRDWFDRQQRGGGH